MRTPTVVQGLIMVAVIAGAIWIVAYVAEGWADWVVFGGILVATMGVIVAYNHRRYPPPTKKRSITRTSDSKW